MADLPAGAAALARSQRADPYTTPGVAGCSVVCRHDRAAGESRDQHRKVREMGGAGIVDRFLLGLLGGRISGARKACGGTGERGEPGAKPDTPALKALLQREYTGFELPADLR